MQSSSPATHNDNSYADIIKDKKDAAGCLTSNKTLLCRVDDMTFGF